MSIREEALLALISLSESFYAEFGAKLDVVSGYRSYERQTNIAA